MKKLVFGVFILILNSGCVEVEEEGEVVCASIGFLAEDIEIYSNFESGRSCREYNNRQSNSTGTDSPGTCFTTSADSRVDDAFYNSSEIIFTNDTIAGISAGDTIAINDSSIFSLNSRHINIIDRDTLVELRRFPIKMSAQKIFVHMDKLIAVGAKNIKVFTYDGELLFENNFDSKVKLVKKGNKIKISENYNANKLSDEELCRSIQYITNEKFESLTNLYTFDLDSLSLVKEKTYYGLDFVHYDRESDYLVYRTYSETVLAKEEQVTKINGLVRSSLHMHEYGDSLHLFAWNFNGSAYYVLNSDLEELHKIEKIAPGESIMAARFNDSFSYLMTYLEQDPLFVFDLSQKDYPELIGELKFPGMPRYLQELNDNELISIGTDQNWELEVSLFDVSEPSNPLRVDKKNLGSFDFDFDYKKLVIYKNNILIKSDSYYYLLKAKNAELKLMTKISILGEARSFFRDDKFYLLDSGHWEAFNLDD